MSGQSLDALITPDASSDPTQSIFLGPRCRRRRKSQQPGRRKWNRAAKGAQPTGEAPLSLTPSARSSHHKQLGMPLVPRGGDCREDCADLHNQFRWLNWHSALRTRRRMSMRAGEGQGGKREGMDWKCSGSEPSEAVLPTTHTRDPCAIPSAAGSFVGSCCSSVQSCSPGARARS